MRSFSNSKSFIPIIIFFVLVVGSAIYGIVHFGSVYFSGNQSFSGAPTPAFFHNDRAQITRIRVKKHNQADCFEVTPDGVVRVYGVCDGDIDEAHRLRDPQYLLRLFRLAAESNLSEFTVPPTSGEYYILTLETDRGTVTVYLSTGSDNPIIMDIITTIDLIDGDIPEPTPVSPTYSPTILPQQTQMPTHTLSPGAPTHTPPTEPTQTQDGGFSCGFSDTGTSKRPHSISDVVCSTGPTPFP